MSIIIFILFSINIFAQSKYEIQGEYILKDGCPWQFRGTNKMSYWDKSYDEVNNWKMDITRETIDMLKSTDNALLSTVAEARKYGFVVILTAFWYDSNDQNFGGSTPYPNCQLLGINPSFDNRWNNVLKRWKEIANLFKNQSDVWFGVWNEPYWYDGSHQYSDNVWETDARAMIKNIRDTGAGNIIVLCGSHMGQGSDVFLTRGKKILADYKNILFDIHTYDYRWGKLTTPQIEDRFIQLQNNGIPFIVGEFANNGTEIYDPIIEAAKNQNVTILAWLWRQYNAQFEASYKYYCSLDRNKVCNFKPTISIKLPTNNQTVRVSKELVISTDATDPDGTIAKVEFYANDTLIGTVNKAPFDFKWTPPFLIAYDIKAKATDNTGAIRMSAPITIFTSDVTGVKSILPSENIKCFPNPADKTISFSIYLEKTEKLSIEVINSVGQVLKIYKSSNIINGYNTININTSDLPSGLYFYRVRVNNEIIDNKIVIQH